MTFPDSPYSGVDGGLAPRSISNVPVPDPVALGFKGVGLRKFALEMAISATPNPEQTVALLDRADTFLEWLTKSE